MTSTPAGPAPGSAARDLMWQAGRAAVIFIFGAAASWVFRSEVVAGAAVAAGAAAMTALPAVVAYAFGAAKTLAANRRLRALAERAGAAAP